MMMMMMMMLYDVCSFGDKAQSVGAVTQCPYISHVVTSLCQRLYQQTSRQSVGDTQNRHFRVADNASASRKKGPATAQSTRSTLF